MNQSTIILSKIINNEKWFIRTNKYLQHKDRQPNSKQLRLLPARSRLALPCRLDSVHSYRCPWRGREHQRRQLVYLQISPSSKRHYWLLNLHRYSPYPKIWRNGSLIVFGENFFNNRFLLDPGCRKRTHGLAFWKVFFEVVMSVPMAIFLLIKDTIDLDIRLLKAALLARILITGEFFGLVQEFGGVSLYEQVSWGNSKSKILSRFFWLPLVSVVESSILTPSSTKSTRLKCMYVCILLL